MECYRHNVQRSKNCLLELVLVLYQLYIDKLQLCRKGKEKFAQLQLAWMETMRDVFHPTEDQSDEERIGIIFYYWHEHKSKYDWTSSSVLNGLR